MVYDSATSGGIEGATVSLPDYNLVAETDEDGYYGFDELAAGTYRVKVSMEGYEVPAVAQLTVSAEVSSVNHDFGLTAISAEKAA